MRELLLKGIGMEREAEKGEKEVAKLEISIMKSKRKCI